MIRLAICALEMNDADGARNPKYPNTFVFDNDFAALLPDAPSFDCK